MARSRRSRRTKSRHSHQSTMDSFAKFSAEILTIFTKSCVRHHGSRPSRFSNPQSPFSPKKEVPKKKVVAARDLPSRGGRSSVMRSIKDKEGLARADRSAACRCGATCGADACSQQKHTQLQIDRFVSGGEGGIRTPDRLAPMPHFECGAFNRSATSPGRHAAALKRAVSGWRQIACGPAYDKALAGGSAANPRLRKINRTAMARSAGRSSAAPGPNAETHWPSTRGRAACAAEIPAGSDRAR